MHGEFHLTCMIAAVLHVCNQLVIAWLLWAKPTSSLLCIACLQNCPGMHPVLLSPAIRQASLNIMQVSAASALVCTMTNIVRSAQCIAWVQTGNLYVPLSNIAIMGCHAMIRLAFYCSSRSTRLPHSTSHENTFTYVWAPSYWHQTCPLVTMTRCIEEQARVVEWCIFLAISSN